VNVQLVYLEVVDNIELRPQNGARLFSTVHSDGSNIPFADGDVKLFSRNAMVSQTPFWSRCGPRTSSNRIGF